MNIFYGYDSEHYVNVTEIVAKKCLSGSEIYIPASEDNRTELFGDPYVGILKHILVKLEDGKEYKFDHNNAVNIRLQKPSEAKSWYKSYGKMIYSPIERLKEVQNHLQLKHGFFNDEFIEQMLCLDFIDENAKVLEIGGNIGRTTLIMNIVLNNSKNLVTFESDPENAEKLKENLILNSFDSHVEAAAISVRPLIQKGWNTEPFYGTIIPDGFKQVTTFSYKDILKKYEFEFDTLVIDCEGAFYYILKDEPEILNSIKLIILENDFKETEHKVFVDDLFKQNNFKRTVAIAGGWGPNGEWGVHDNFYEVWARDLDCCRF